MDEPLKLFGMEVEAKCGCCEWDNSIGNRCKNCNGTGFIANAEGAVLLEFLRRYMEPTDLAMIIKK